MKDAHAIPSASSHATPVACPACESSLIVTKAKQPDDEAYWRCTACGEIWNEARSETDRRGAQRWR